MNKVLIVAAHPDDELLGVGGIVLKHKNEGDEVRAIIFCEGESLRYKKDVGQKDAIVEASEVLGIDKTYHLKFPDQKLDQYCLTDIITPIEKISEEYKPNLIYCQCGFDANRDHKILFEAANIAFRPTHFWVKELYCFYTTSSTEWGYPRQFIPDTWVDISKFLAKKIEAFEKYHSEVREYPHPRSSASLEYQAHFWGNQCCLDAAEVLMTIRKIVK